MAVASDQLRQFLSGIPVFGGLEERTLAQVISMLVEERHAPGEEICREGDNGRSMYVVGEGEVVVCRQGEGDSQVRMVRLGRGEFFGEMALIDPQPRSATVVVEKQATLYALGCKDLYSLYQEDLQGYVMLMQNLCRELARRLRRADERICVLVAKTDAAEVTQIRPGPSVRQPARRVK